jgi:hypothetical protein
MRSAALSHHGAFKFSQMINKIKPYWIFALPLVVIVPILLLGFYVLAAGPGAPLQYTERSYTPEHSVLAPGDTLVYTPTLVIRRAGRIEVLRSFWSVDTSKDAALCSGDPAPIIEIVRNRPASIIGNVRGGVAVTVPVPNLPPGRYLLLTSVSGPGGGQDAYEVPFVITKNCA